MNDQNASPRRPAARTLLVGNGKLARHLSHYLELKSAPYFHWKNARSIAHIPEPELAQATVIWILVSDQAISEVQLNIKKLAPHAVYFHSSAALSVPGVFTLHPLQTFGPRLYELSTYQNITFTAIKEEWTEVPQAGLELMKALANPLQTLANSDRTLYHAACTMTANFPIILWTEVFRMMDKKTGISSEAFLPLLRQTAENFFLHGAAALTGPLVRGDKLTVQKHQEALNSTPLAPLYQSFIELYVRSQKGNPKS